MMVRNEEEILLAFADCSNRHIVLQCVLYRGKLAKGMCSPVLTKNTG